MASIGTSATRRRRTTVAGLLTAALGIALFIPGIAGGGFVVMLPLFGFRWGTLPYVGTVILLGGIAICMAAMRPDRSIGGD